MEEEEESGGRWTRVNVAFSVIAYSPEGGEGALCIQVPYPKIDLTHFFIAC